MKKLTFLWLISFISFSLMAQTRLSVAGSIRIDQGRLDITSSGSSSIFIGSNAGLNNTSSGVSNVFIGKNAGLRNTDGKFNTFLGTQVGVFNTTGSRNTFIGDNVGSRNTTGGDNTFIGQDAGFANTTGGANTFVGSRAGNRNTTGLVNTFIGQDAGRSNTTGDENTFVGENAGFNNTTSQDNTFVGQDAGKANTSGHNNTFLGQAAGLSNAGSQNTFLGETAGIFHTTGDNNTLVGYNADFTSGNPTENSFAIGANALVSKSNSGFIGNISTQEVRSYVNLSTASDKRMKRNIRTDIKGLDFILQLRPVSYQMDMNKLDKFLRKDILAKARKAKGEVAAELREELSAGQVHYQKALAEKAKIRYTGFLAQDVEKAVKKAGFEFSGLIKPTNDQDHYSLRYAEFVVPLVKGMQEQQMIIEQQEKVMEQQQSEMNQLVQEMTTLREVISNMQTTITELLGTETSSKNENGQARLGQNHPNPLSTSTTFAFEIPNKIKKAEIRITNAIGQWVESIPISQRGKGQISWHKKDLSTGQYYYSLLLDSQLDSSKKMIISK